MVVPKGRVVIENHFWEKAGNFNWHALGNALVIENLVPWFGKEQVHSHHLESGDSSQQLGNLQMVFPKKGCGTWKLIMIWKLPYRKAKESRFSCFSCRPSSISYDLGEVAQWLSGSTIPSARNASAFHDWNVTPIASLQTSRAHKCSHHSLLHSRKACGNKIIQPFYHHTDSIPIMPSFKDYYF